MGLGTKLAIFGRRLKDASLRRMNQNIQAIHQETGKNRLFLLCDMVWCTLRYGVGYLDYHVFGFARNRGANRKTFMTMNHNVSLARMVNDAAYYPLLNDKFQFLQRYGAFLGRRWLDLRQAGPQELARLCRERGVPFILDASQSAGCLPVHLEELGAAFIAMPGHKGLYGPQGTGVLLCGKDVPVRTLLEGGTGSISIQQEMPDFLPDRLEAGTHNMPGIAGLLAGVRFVRQLGPEAICAGERQLTFQAAEGLRRLPGLQVFALPDLAAQAGVLSIVPERMDAEALGAALADRGIAVRAGLHCAPLAHRTAGTLDTGTVRLSFSHWNTREEVSRFLVAMGEILR